MNAPDYFTLGSLLLFLIIFTGRSIVLHAKGVAVLAIGKGKKTSENIFEKFLLMLFGIWIYQLIITTRHIKMALIPLNLTIELIDLNVMNILGMILMASGIVIFISALYAFRTSWRIGIDTDHPGALIKSGIFAHSRNPVFLAIDLFTIGTALTYSSWFFIIMALLIIICLHIQIVKEEKRLAELYGSSYSAYCRSVRRYI